MPWVPELFSAPVLQRLEERSTSAPYVRGQQGKLAAARIHDDVDPPAGKGV